ncbi:MAG: DUF4373 domain-containing protein [Clostridia bacterium]|nr:DUF4373 domain-containing protein [Clostridia bacterium]
MGRPKKQTVDYFPHFVEGTRRTLFVLEEEWRNDGYAFWFKLLELLCKSDGHYFDISSPADQKYLCAFAKVPQDTATEILNTLAELGKIDRELWENRKIIWCQSLVDNLKGLYDKRTTQMPTKPVFEEIKPENETKNSETEISDTETPPKPAEPPEPAEPPKPKGPKQSVSKADIDAFFEHLWKLYPVKKGKGQVSDAAKKRLFSIGKEEMERAIERYLKELKKDSEWRKPQNGSTFFNSGYIDYLDANFTPQEEAGKNGGAGDHGQTETPTGNNGSTAYGGFKPSTGFKPKF